MRKNIGIFLRKNSFNIFRKKIYKVLFGSIGTFLIKNNSNTFGIKNEMG